MDYTFDTTSVFKKQNNPELEIKIQFDIKKKEVPKDPLFSGSSL